MYDFDSCPDRRGTDSLKWNVAEGELPMWVADMDFPAPPAVREALQQKLDHGVFGYCEVSARWEDACIAWWRTRYGFTMEREWLVFCTGVIPALSSSVRKLTTPDENVVIQTPVYNIFFNSIVNNGRRVLENPLLYENGAYRMDFDDLERKLADPQTSMMILCNPHNPVGKTWDRETLARVGALCEKYRVTVISDEIHCDLTAPGVSYVPFASASDVCRRISVTCLAPTKTFNIAGLQTACVSVPDPFLRHKVWRALNTDEVAEPNAFACAAAVAAWEKGGPWLDELRAYLFENRRIAEETVRAIPSLRAVGADATYLLWLECLTRENGDEVASYLRRTTGLILCAGSGYGRAGERFLRLNLACPRATLLDGLERLKQGMSDLKAR